jgi:hypothetical protein
MLPIDLRIDRAQRLLRLIEEDAPLLDVRLAPLSREHQESARLHARQLAELAREEIRKLMEEKNLGEISELSPQAAD